MVNHHSSPPFGDYFLGLGTHGIMAKQIHVIWRVFNLDGKNAKKKKYVLITKVVPEEPALNGVEMDFSPRKKNG